MYKKGFTVIESLFVLSITIFLSSLCMTMHTRTINEQEEIALIKAMFDEARAMAIVEKDTVKVSVSNHRIDLIFSRAPCATDKNNKNRRRLYTPPDFFETALRNAARRTFSGMRLAFRSTLRPLRNCSCPHRRRGIPSRRESLRKAFRGRCLRRDRRLRDRRSTRRLHNDTFSSFTRFIR